MSKARSIATSLDLAETCARDARTLLAIRSRNAAYLASQAAEQLTKAVASSEDLHVERRDAHQLDTIVRMIPDANIDKGALTSLSFLEAYSTTYRYGTPTGRMPLTPDGTKIGAALDAIDRLIESPRRHFAIGPRAKALPRIGCRWRQVMRLPTSSCSSKEHS